MESFLRRMSSIVRKTNHKSSDPGDNEDDNDQEEIDEESHFHRLQQRRRSAPDIRRRTNQGEKTPIELDQKVISVEEINSQSLIRHINTNSFTRKQYQSIGKSSHWFNSREKENLR